MGESGMRSRYEQMKVRSMLLRMYLRDLSDRIRGDSLPRVKYTIRRIDCMIGDLIELSDVELEKLPHQERRYIGWVEDFVCGAFTKVEAAVIARPELSGYVSGKRLPTINRYFKDLVNDAAHFNENLSPSQY